MLANVRRNKIHELLMEDGTASVSDLNVSEFSVKAYLPKDDIERLLKLLLNLDYIV